VSVRATHAMQISHGFLSMRRDATCPRSGRDDSSPFEADLDQTGSGSTICLEKLDVDLVV
jgi:hypothetical protein